MLIATQLIVLIARV